MEKPLVSYVLTAYNIEDFIEESVKCAFAQTYENLEIILSDDHSTDGTYDIMKQMAQEYQGPHKVVLNRNEQNIGITKHMNKCYLELAQGDIIIAAHGDDISIPERTDICVNYLLEHPDYTAVSMSMEAVDENGKRLETDLHDAKVSELKVLDFSTGGNIPAPSRAFYKKVMTSFGPLNDDCPTEDELITFRALMLGKNALLPQVGVYYRKHKGSNSNPEFFDRFPLEKILKQQNDDMLKAIDLGLITEEQRAQKYRKLEKAMHIRKRYRKYYADRSVKNLMALIKPHDVDLRAKLHYIKGHIKNKKV